MTEELVLKFVFAMSGMLIMLVVGIVATINFGDEIEDFAKKIKRNIKYSVRKKEVKRNKKIDIFNVEYDFWMDGVKAEQKEINNVVFEIEEEIDNTKDLNGRFIEEMNRKINDIKVLVKDYEKMKKTDKLVVETDVKKTLEKITKELRVELKTIKEERQEKIKEIYQRKIEKLEAK